MELIGREIKSNGELLEEYQLSNSIDTKDLYTFVELLKDLGNNILSIVISNYDEDDEYYRKFQNSNSFFIDEDKQVESFSAKCFLKGKEYYIAIDLIRNTINSIYEQTINVPYIIQRFEEELEKKSAMKM